MFLPVFVVLAILASMGPSLLMTAMNVKYRDFRHCSILQFGIYVSPVGFSSSRNPEKWRLLYSLNPAVGVIDGFRWSSLRGVRRSFYIQGFLASLGVALLFLWIGIAYFRRTEKTFADSIWMPDAVIQRPGFGQTLSDRTPVRA